MDDENLLTKYWPIISAIVVWLVISLAAFYNLKGDFRVLENKLENIEKFLMRGP